MLFFFRQKTADDMRISDWCSDVCSSDLSKPGEVPAEIDEKAPVVSSVGNLWLLGDHRLICGDGTSAEVFEKLMGAEKAQMVFTADRKSVVQGKSVSGRVDLGGGRISTKKNE